MSDTDSRQGKLSAERLQEIRDRVANAGAADRFGYWTFTRDLLREIDRLDQSRNPAPAPTGEAERLTPSDGDVSKVRQDQWSQGEAERLAADNPAIHEVSPRCPNCEGIVVPDAAADETRIVTVTRCACGALVCSSTDDPRRCVLVTNGVYFIECAGFIKIGVCSDLSSRLRSIQSLNPLPLAVIGFIPTRAGEERTLERILHASFFQFRHQFEWFVGTPEIREWISAHTLAPAKFLERL